MPMLPVRSSLVLALSLISTNAIGASLCLGNCGPFVDPTSGGSIVLAGPSYSEVTVQQLTTPRSFQWNGFMASAQFKSTPKSGYDLEGLSSKLGLVAGQALPVSFSLNLTQLTTSAAVTNLNTGAETRIHAHRYALASYTLSFGDIVVSETPAPDAVLPAHPLLDTSTLQSGFYASPFSPNNWSPFRRDVTSGELAAVRFSSALLNISGEAASAFVTTPPEFGTSLNSLLSLAQNNIFFLMPFQSTSLVFNLGGDVSAFPDLYPETDVDLSTLFDAGEFTLGLNPLAPNFTVLAEYVELRAVLSSTNTPLSIDPSLELVPSFFDFPGEGTLVTVPLPPAAWLLVSSLLTLTRQRRSSLPVTV